MGSILKTRQLTTFAEGAIVAICVGIVMTVVYFATLNQGTNADGTNTTDSANVVQQVGIDTVASNQTNIIEPIKSTPVAPTTAPAKAAQPVKSQKAVASKPAPQVKNKPKAEKPTRKKGAERENLEINF